MKKSKDAAKPSDPAHIDQSPSHLLHRVLQIALDIYTTEMGEGALTQRQYAVLKALEGTEGLSQSDLVKITGIDRSTMAELVTRMIAKELLSREKSPTDARANLVMISVSGQAALSDMQPKVVAADEKILALLSPPKRESFVKLLRKIVHTKDEGFGDDAAAKKAVKAQKVKKKTLKAAKKQKKLPVPEDHPVPEAIKAVITD
jgi:DNA-binding MarR family transcriptional regulator